MANITKLDFEKATVRQLFKAVAYATDEINETLFIHGQTKCRLQVQPMAQASEFYVPNMFNDRILLTSKGHPDIRGWSDQELVKTKPGWEALGIANSSLLLGVRYDHMSNEYQIPQTMAGVEIDADSVEYQAWYTSSSNFLLQAIFEAQYKFSEILTKYFEESNRTERQKQSYYHATERWRDIEIALMNKLAKVKSTL